MSNSGYNDPAPSHSYREVGTPFTAAPAPRADGYSAAPFPATLPQPRWVEPVWAEEADDEPDNMAYYYPEYPVDFSNFRNSFEQSAHTRLIVALTIACVFMGIGIWGLLNMGSPDALPLAQVQNAANAAVVAPAVAAMPPQVQTAAAHTGTAIAPFFAPSVRYWEPKIIEWATNHGLDPNMVATVMQIESCGDPAAVSVAGAQGLFQVMPFHFEQGEAMTDPDMNAYRGMKFLAEVLVMFDGNPGLSFAGYNGGPGTARKAWDNWPNETQRYYRWGLGIYTEASAGHTTSETLNQWMTAGGASLCRQASERLGLE